MDYLKIKNWEQYQHYKERNPPWVKLYHSLLDDYEYTQLNDASKLLLVSLFLLASRTKNKIPADAGYIKSKTAINGPINWTQLVSSGFVVIIGDASKVLASCKQNADSETETEKRRDIKRPASPDSFHKALIIQLDQKCKTINTLPKKESRFNPYSWITWAINHQYHPEAVSSALDSLVSNWAKISNPWTYATTVIKKESGNQYEKDATKCVAQEKNEWMDLVRDLKAVHEKRLTQTTRS